MAGKARGQAAAWTPSTTTTKVRTWAGVVLQIVEVLALVGVALWVAIGAYSYGSETHWTLRGLLTLLDERWKGTLILAGFLLYRTIQEVLARTKKFRAPWGELGESIEPAGDAQEVKRGAGKEPKS